MRGSLRGHSCRGRQGHSSSWVGHDHALSPWVVPSPDWASVFPPQSTAQSGRRRCTQPMMDSWATINFEMKGKKNSDTTKKKKKAIHSIKKRLPSLFTREMQTENTCALVKMSPVDVVKSWRPHGAVVSCGSNLLGGCSPVSQDMSTSTWPGTEILPADLHQPKREPTYAKTHIHRDVHSTICNGLEKLTKCQQY